jgi:hypothetical protein
MALSVLSQRRRSDTRQLIRRRLVALALLSMVGGFAFLPFLSAGSHQPMSRLLPFVAAVTGLGSLAAWLGLRAADAVGLPMPLLRRLEGDRAGGISARTIGITLLCAAGLGVIGLVALRLVDAPPLPGGLAARALSAIFAAGPLEIVLHLGVMSSVVWLTRGPRWTGVVAAALCLVGFHLTGGALAQPARIIIVTVVGNGVIGLALGCIYALYGFECAMLGHVVAHLITVLPG